LSGKPLLRLERLSKLFGSQQVLHDLDLEVAEGEIFSLLGPSGSGKTTLLRLLAGFEQPDFGRIFVGEEEVTALSPLRRGFGMVFQSYALFPHLDVAQNVAFGLAAKGTDRVEIRRRVQHLLEMVGCEGLAERRIDEISGGQQQRVALARALAPEPRVLLLDEPLSNLDKALRERTRRELQTLIRRLGITTLLVTHEQEEAFDLGDRVGILHASRLEQVGSSRDVYERPETRFVATFIGRSSVVPGMIEEVRGHRCRVFLLGDGSSPVSWWANAATALEVGDAVELIVRPESLHCQTGSAPITASVAVGHVAGGRYTGSASFARVALEIGAEVEVQVAIMPPVGERVLVEPRGNAPNAPEPRVFPRRREAR
jgi:ABC-type Fe3+/spermidine/putrescine transport system ATPase subunit